MNETLVLALIVSVAVGVLIGFVAGFRVKGDRVEKDLKELADWRKYCLRKEGAYWPPGSRQVRYYNLRSLDGGQTWYAVEIDDTFYSVKILGKAEDVFPGILGGAELEELTDFCFLHGGPTLEEASAAEYNRLLARAGVQALPRP